MLKGGGGGGDGTESSSDFTIIYQEIWWKPASNLKNLYSS